MSEKTLSSAWDTVSEDWGNSTYGNDITIETKNGNLDFSTLSYGSVLTNENAFEDAYDSARNDANDYVDSVVDTLNSTKDDMNNIEQSSSAVIHGLSTLADSEQYESLSHDILLSASNVLRERLDEILSYFTTTTPMSIGAIMKEVAPYADDWRNATSNVRSNIRGLINKIDLKEYLGDYAKDVLEDEAVQESMSSLSIVESYAGTLETVTSTIEMIEKVVGIIEPWLPVLRLTSNLALSYWSGGATALQSSEEVMEERYQTFLKLMAIPMFYIKKYLYSIEINVPKFLTTNDLNIFSVKKASADFGVDNNENKNLGFSSMFFNDNLYEDALKTQSNSKFLRSLETGYVDKMNWTKKQLKNAETLGWFESANKDSIWYKYKDSFVKSYMNKIVDKARTDIYSNKYDNYFKNFGDYLKDTVFGQGNNNTVSTTAISSSGVTASTVINIESLNSIIESSHTVYRSLKGIS